MRQAAETCEREAIYPVDSLVLDIDGTMLSAVWIQDLMQFGPRPPSIKRPPFKFSGDWTAGYQKFLDLGLKRFLGE